MTSQLDVAKGREIVARWCNLAEQRLEYLTELFETGRWRRFHSEQSFLENIREAKAAVEAWRELSSREASRDNRAIDLSWLGRPKTAIPLNELRRDQVVAPEIKPRPIQAIAIETQLENAILVDDERDELNQALPVEALSTEALATAPLDENAFAAVLDLATLAARYPILRNTL